MYLTRNNFWSPSKTLIKTLINLSGDDRRYKFPAVGHQVCCTFLPPLQLPLEKFYWITKSLRLARPYYDLNMLGCCLRCFGEGLINDFPLLFWEEVIAFQVWHYTSHYHPSTHSTSHHSFIHHPPFILENTHEIVWFFIHVVSQNTKGSICSNNMRALEKRVANIDHVNTDQNLQVF